MEIRVVAIRPMMPNVGIRVRLKIIPSVQVRSVSFRLMSVLPCPLMRFPELRFPNAVYRYVIMYKERKSGVDSYFPGNSVATAAAHVRRNTEPKPKLSNFHS